MRAREGALQTWRVALAMVAVIALATVFALREWSLARREEVLATTPKASTLSLANAAREASSCVDKPTLTLPEPTALLADLRRSAAASLQLADMRFENMARSPGAAQQLELDARAQGTYAAGKDAMRAVLERYPGSALVHLRLQRPTESSAEVQWAFRVAFTALPCSLQPSNSR